jgi:hypothetical protein
MRRLFVFLALSVAIGCGLTFSPGDYSAPAESVDGAAIVPETGPASDAPQTPDETGPPAPSLHLLLFAGAKDTGGANDVWVATVNDAGDLGPFGYLQSTPLLQPFQAFGLADGKLLSVVQGNKVRVVQSADFDGGITSTWATTTVANAPTSGYGSFFAKASVVVVGGQTSEEVDDGTGTGGTVTVTTNHPELYVSKPAADGGYPAPNNVTSPTKLPVGLFNVTTVIYKDFVYLWGSGDKTTQGKTFVGKVDEAAGLSSVTETTPIVAQGATPTSAMACAGEGRLFVVNGDAAMSADITEASGALGAWKTGAVLPSARTAAGCAVIKGWLYLFGGRLISDSGSKLTNEILRSKIGPDGTLAKWETTAQTLLGARANVFVLTY